LRTKEEEHLSFHVPQDDLFVLEVVASMTAQGFAILSQVMLYDRSTNPGICKHASPDWRRPLSAKDIWSFQYFQSREIFVYEDQSPVREDMADVQAKILKVYCDAGPLLTKAW
jgi:hypothetical protein